MESSKVGTRGKTRSVVSCRKRHEDVPAMAYDIRTPADSTPYSCQETLNLHRIAFDEGIQRSFGGELKTRNVGAADSGGMEDDRH